MPPVVQPKLLPFNEEGLNDALDLVWDDDEVRTRVIQGLRTNPRAVVRQTFRLTAAQRLALMRASDQDIRRITDHVAAALESGDDELSLYLVRPGEEDLTPRMRADVRVEAKFGPCSISASGSYRS